MGRLLIIPGAGLGTRLGAETPKLLAAVNGRPMLLHLLTMYAHVAEHVVVVVHPSAREAVRLAVQDAPAEVPDIWEQDRPAGMLDAILIPRAGVEAARPRRVWITWCDQVAIHPRTIDRLVEAEAGDPLVAFPTCRGESPYVHFARDRSGRIDRVLHRREGDPMPHTGESDAGLFSLSLAAYLELLPEFAADPEVGTSTGERNFLPFIPWAARRGPVVTFPCTEPEEAIGVNTPEDLAVVERTLRARVPIEP